MFEAPSNPVGSPHEARARRPLVLRRSTYRDPVGDPARDPLALQEPPARSPSRGRAEPPLEERGTLTIGPLEGGPESHTEDRWSPRRRPLFPKTRWRPLWRPLWRPSGIKALSWSLKKRIEDPYPPPPTFGDPLETLTSPSTEGFRRVEHEGYWRTPGRPLETLYAWRPLETPAGDPTGDPLWRPAGDPLWRPAGGPLEALWRPSGSPPLINGHLPKPSGGPLEALWRPSGGPSPSKPSIPEDSWRPLWRPSRSLPEAAGEIRQIRVFIFSQIKYY